MQRTPHAPSLAGLALIGVWLVVYVVRAISGHLSLRTNAFDLSVFDQALWSLRHGGSGWVTFMGQSIFSHHFMPILFLIVPLYALWPSPVFLIALQLTAVGAAGWLFFRTARRLSIGGAAALGLLFVFLFSRWTHGAAVSFFYPECLQPLLTLAVIALWPMGGWRYWTIAVLLLATKEDAALYLASFAAVQWLREPAAARRAIATLSVSVVWLVIAFTVAIPLSRRHDGVNANNAIVEARYGGANGQVSIPELIGRAASWRSVRVLARVTGTVGFLAFGGLESLAPMVPATMVNLAAVPDSLQANLLDHYAFPVIPWVFSAAAVGFARLSRRSARLATALLVLVIAGNAIDSPALRGVYRPIDPNATAVLDQLRTVSGTAGGRAGGTVVFAQTDLIPHLPHGWDVLAVDGKDPPRQPDLVLFTHVGDTWPLTSAQIDIWIARYRADPRYREAISGPLFAFARR